MKLKLSFCLLAIGLLSFRFSEEIINTINQQVDLPTIPYNYTDISIPTHLSTNVLNGPLQNAATDNDNTPTTNPTTNDGATLGRVLFYDVNLSANQTVSCASCHQQENGFSDSRVLSIGFDGGTTRRHSMGLTNAVWYDRGRFFWDERAATLEEQVLDPFQDPVEMGMTLESVISAVEEQVFYPELFNKAFGSTEINSERISKALAQFIRSMVSVNSKYDIGRQEVTRPTTNFSNFTDSENNGKRLFFLPKSNGGLSCVGCHSTEAFINPDAGTTNNGLDINTSNDEGVFEAIPNPAFQGTFKVPSLKNVELTAPYMHDGRFATLEEVVEHYNSGVQAHPNLNSSLKDENGNPQRLNLSEQDKIDVVNFLKTLTDETMINDDKFSDPFIRDQCPTEIVCNDNLTGTNTISAAEYITANGTIATESVIVFEAGDSIVLKPGFSVAAGATFTAQIKDCVENELVEVSANQRNTSEIQTNLVISPQKEMELVIQPNPSSGTAKIVFELSKNSPITIHLFDHSGKLLRELLVAKDLSAGQHELQVVGDDLYRGLFYVVLKTPSLTMTQKMVVVK